MISNEERRKVARRLRELDHVVTNRDTIESGSTSSLRLYTGTGRIARLSAALAICVASQ